MPTPHTKKNHAQILIEQASLLLSQVLRFAQPSDAVVAHFFRQNRRFQARDRATLTETVYTVLRHKTRLEMLARTAPKGLGSRDRRLAILAFAGAQDFLQTGLNAAEKEWLLACQAFPVEELQAAHRHNLPDWLIERLSQRFDPTELAALSAALLETAPLDLRVNTALAKREEVLLALEKEGIAATATPYSPWGIRIQKRTPLQRLDIFKQGLIEVQDEGSQLLALLLEPKRGEMVVDFCAGAGGKTLALGAQMRNTGRLYAFDISAYRLTALKPRLARSGLSNVHPVAIAHERDERIKRLRGKIDRVLVDAPCSGLGTLRRNPDLKWRQQPKNVQEYAQQQAQILQQAALLLKPGGRLVYATCSLLPEENEDIANAFEAQHPDYKRINVADILGNEQLAHNGYLQLWPHLHHTDGFFAAVWEKSQ